MQLSSKGNSTNSKSSISLDDGGGRENVEQWVRGEEQEGSVKKWTQNASKSKSRTCLGRGQAG